MNPSQSVHRLLRGGLLCAGIVACIGASGCVHHHHDDGPGHTVIVDEHGYRHEGYRDAQGWHGGYYDEQHQFHPDGADWHGDHR